MELLVALLVGVVVGAIAATIAVLGRARADGRRRQAAVDAELAAARTRAERATSEAQALRTRLVAADALATRVVTLEGELATARVELDAFRGSGERGRARRPVVTPVTTVPRTHMAAPAPVATPAHVAAPAPVATPAPELPSAVTAPPPAHAAEPIPAPQAVVVPASSARLSGARRRRPGVEEHEAIDAPLPPGAPGREAVGRADASGAAPQAVAASAQAAAPASAPASAQALAPASEPTTSDATPIATPPDPSTGIAVPDPAAAPAHAPDATEGGPAAVSAAGTSAATDGSPATEPAGNAWRPIRPGLSDPRSWIGTTAPNGAVYGEDDLERIHGVGPYLAARLRGVGVVTWRQVAEWDDDDMTLMSRRIGSFPDRIRREDWPASARALHEAAYGEVLPGSASD